MNPRLKRYLGRLDVPQDYLVREFVEHYEEGDLSRRDLLERVFRITGSSAATAGVLLSLGVRPAFADPLASASVAPPAQTPPQSPLSVAPNDPAVVAGPVTFPNGGATIMAYMARPAAAGRYPAVMICHENAGTSPHFEDVARRYAKAGYVGIALDLLSRQGGTAAVPANERGRALSAPDTADQQVSDFQAAMAFLRRQPFVLADRIGMTGFCFGGGVVWNVAVAEPTLRAAVPYYGFGPEHGDELGNIRAPVLACNGELDTRVTETNRDLVQQVTAMGKIARQNVYPGAGHAFFNDTQPFRGNFGYVESASLAAWRDTLAWFGTYLRGAGLPGTGDGSVDEEAAVEGEPAEAEPAETGPSLEHAAAG